MSGTPTELLAECDAQGIRLTLAGEGLEIDAPRSALSPELLGRLKAHKGELLALIERRSERAAIVEDDGDLDWPEAERRAAKPQPEREPLFPPWVIEALREATLSLVGPSDGPTSAEVEPHAEAEVEAPAILVATGDWPADTVDPLAVAPCSKCGGVELWQSAVGTWRCSKCEPPVTSRRVAALAERIRKQKKPKAEAAPNGGCPCGSTRVKDTPIHGGQSIRRDCARCGRFLGFPIWYGEA